MTATRTTWLLDVDGVINARRPEWHEAPRTATVTLSHHGRVSTSWKLRWAPSLLAELRKIVAEGLVGVRWCTTWNTHDAAGVAQVRVLEALWNLPKLPTAFGDVVSVGSAKRRAALGVVNSGHRLIWTDDDEVPDHGEFRDMLAGPGTSSLLIRPTERTGLTPEHLAEIREFVAAGAR